MIRWILFVTSCLGLAGDDGGTFAERKAAMDPVSRRFLRPNDDVRPLPAIDGVAPTSIEFRNPAGVTSFAMVGNNTRLSVESRGAEFARFTFTDGKSMQHTLVRVASDRPTECSIALSFLATQAIATPQFTARVRDGGLLELAASPVTSDLANFREFERLAQPPLSSTSRSVLARRFDAIERALPDATRVSSEVAPRYALALNPASSVQTKSAPFSRSARA